MYVCLLNRNSNTMRCDAIEPKRKTFITLRMKIEYISRCARKPQVVNIQMKIN